MVILFFVNSFSAPLPQSAILPNYSTLTLEKMKNKTDMFPKILKHFLCSTIFVLIFLLILNQILNQLQ